MIKDLCDGKKGGQMYDRNVGKNRHHQNTTTKG